MYFATVLSLTVLAQQAAAMPDAVAFKRLVDSSHANIKDYSVVYEGRQKWVGRERTLGKPVKEFDHTFQGSYYYRHRDGAELMDVYVKGRTDPAMVIREKKSILGETFTTATIITDLAAEEVASMPGNTGLLNGPQSPHPLFHHWYFRRLTDMRRWGYECRGWEVVDGRNCLVVRLNWDPDVTYWYHVFWMDMERGANPLKVEEYDEHGLFARIRNVELASFALPDGDQHVWLPVSCVVEGLSWEGEVYDRPVMQETRSVVRGSVSVNQGLADALFKIKETTDATVARELSRRLGDSPLRQDFVRLAAESPPPDRGQRRRIDLQVVEESLDKLLQDADAQSERLDASAEAAAAHSWGRWAPYGLVAAGFLAITAAVVVVVLRRSS